MKKNLGFPYWETNLNLLQERVQKLALNLFVWKCCKRKFRELKLSFLQWNRYISLKSSHHKRNSERFSLNPPKEDSRLIFFTTKAFMNDPLWKNWIQKPISILRFPYYYYFFINFFYSSAINTIYLITIINVFQKYQKFEFKDTIFLNLHEWVLLDLQYRKAFKCIKETDLKVSITLLVHPWLEIISFFFLEYLWDLVGKDILIGLIPLSDVLISIICVPDKFGFVHENLCILMSEPNLFY